MTPQGSGLSEARRRRRRNNRRAKRQRVAYADPGPYHGRPRQQARPKPTVPPAELPLVSLTWAYVRKGAVHVASDRHWFGDDYVSFNVVFRDIHGVAHEAIGIGSVSLPVDLLDNGHGELVLRNVLHYPPAAYNFIGSSITKDTNFMILDPNAEILKLVDDRRRPVACFEQRRDLRVLKLSGPPRGARLGPYQPDKPFTFPMHLAKNERERFAAFQRKKVFDTLSDAERAWLSEHWGSEFKFLRAYGFNINKDDQRNEGRELMRGMMASDRRQQANGQGRDGQASGRRGGFGVSQEHDLYLINRLFSTEQLSWIESRIGCFEEFLDCFRPLFQRDDECREGMRQLEDLMRHDL